MDFTSLVKNIRTEDIKKVLTEKSLFEIKKEYKSKATLKIERLKYNGILETPNSIKVEIDCFQNVVLPSVRRKYKNAWGIVFDVNVMDPIEICAEKLRACNDRFRYRDFYDLYMMAKTLNLNIKKAIALIPKKEIRKPFSKKNIINNLNLALNEISKGDDTVIYKKSISKRNITEFFNCLTLPTIETPIHPL